MYCAISSEWGLFGRNTRSAFRRTPSPPREERADIGKDDVVEARKWIPNTPYIINTRARRCACIYIRLAAIKASNCIIVSLDSRRRFILVDLSAKIIKHDHVVLNAQWVEQVKHSLWLVRTALQQRTRLARWGCRRSSSSQKVTNFLGTLFG